MDVTEAELLPAGQGALLPLPCGHAARLSKAEVDAAWQVDRECCDVTYGIVPVADEILALINSKSRNQPGKLIVIVERRNE